MIRGNTRLSSSLNNSGSLMAKPVRFFYTAATQQTTVHLLMTARLQSDQTVFAIFPVEAGVRLGPTGQ
jgi:hypothetical protein